MKHIWTIWFVMVVLTGFSQSVTTQIPDEIPISLKTGDAGKLARFFNQNIELVVLESENVYSKAHAEQVISNFFKNNPPSKFTILHQGGKGDSSYAIGTLTTRNQNFRVYFLIKMTNNVPLIHQLRIEKQND